MRDDVKQAVEYLANQDRLRADLEHLLSDGFSSVFIHPDVMDSNSATTLVVANSNFHKVTWTMAGLPTVLGTTFEQGAFASNFSRIADIVELARVKEPNAFPGISMSLLTEFAEAVMLVRSGIEDSSPQLGVLRNELLGQLDFLGNAIRLQARSRGIPKKEPRKPRLNSLMVDLLQKHGQEKCVSWSVESWAIQLESQWGNKPSKSSIAKTETWKLISELRRQAGTDLRERQTVKDKQGKRRSKAY